MLEFENERGWVLKVLVRSGKVEKSHTHRCPSVFTVTSMPKIKYFYEKEEECPRSRKRAEGVPFWLDPERVHCVENPEDRPLEAIRVEFERLKD